MSKEDMGRFMNLVLADESLRIQLIHGTVPDFIELILPEKKDFDAVFEAAGKAKQLLENSINNPKDPEVIHAIDDAINLLARKIHLYTTKEYPGK